MRTARRSGWFFTITYVDDQAELETYIVYCGFNEEGPGIDRHFYGNGYRYRNDHSILRGQADMGWVLMKHATMIRSAGCG